MNLKLFSILITSLVNIGLQAQKRVNVDLNFNVYKSIGNETLKNYRTADGYLGLEYFDKKRFKNPFISFTGNISYPVSKKMHAGLQTGVYMTFKEIYISYPPTNHFSVPLQATLKYEAIAKSNYSVGVIAAGGINIFNVYELTDRYKNAALYNCSFYYKHARSSFKIGIEKQVDNVTVYLNEISAYTKEDLYKYKLKRISGFISYGLTIR